ncbi:HAMP domain-containing protein [candidate division KSB1 bacterium]|nr:HAMP domain-containing protein [candidate division KSB1 bacterium]
MQRKLGQMLSVRLFLLILAVMVVGFIIYTYHAIHKHTNDLMQTVFLSADRTGNVIKRSTHYAMLINRKEDLYHTINTIGNEPGVDGIRIYNKRGQIIVSTDAQEVGRIVDMEEEACYVCHNKEQPLEVLPQSKTRRVYEGQKGHRLLGVIKPINNEPECSNAACHAHDASQKILGVLDVRMSLQQIDEKLASSRRELIFFAALLILGVGLSSGSFIYVVVRRRIKHLINGTREVASGKLDHRIAISGSDEIGQLASSFNKMTADLQKARHEITEWSTSLEEKVAEKTLELKEAQSHLIQMERLASLGKLSATVAHEINNPLAGVLNYTYLVLRVLRNEDFSEERIASLNRYLEFIKSEVARCGDIVKNMLIFARQGGGHFSREKVSHLIDSGLMLVNHQLELKQIKLAKNIQCDDDEISCDPGQIRQALVALFVNAIEAMDAKGQLNVNLLCDKEVMTIEIQDSGCGVPKEMQDKIFDPFFSTKKEGKGVGLGLSVVYGIIKRHKGDIRLESMVDVGTTVTIELPRNPVPDANVNVSKETISEL